MTVLKRAPGRSLGLLALGLCISAGALWLLFRSVDLSATSRVLVGAALPPLAGAIAVLAVQATVRAMRWHSLLTTAVDRQLPFRPVLGAMLAGYLGNAVLPARLGEVVRATLLARALTVPAATVLGTAVLERLLDILVLALVGAAVLTLLDVPPWVGAIVAVAVGAAALGFVVLVVLARHASHLGSRSRAVPRVAQRAIGDLGAGVGVIESSSGVAVAAGLTLGAWCLDAILFWLVAQSLGVDLSPAHAVLVSVVAVLSTVVPSAPGYVGTFELAVVAASALAGVTGPVALAFAVLAHVTTLLPLALGGAVAIVAMQGRPVAQSPGSVASRRQAS